MDNSFPYLYDLSPEEVRLNTFPEHYFVRPVPPQPVVAPAPPTPPPAPAPAAFSVGPVSVPVPPPLGFLKFSEEQRSELLGRRAWKRGKAPKKPKVSTGIVRGGIGAVTILPNTREEVEAELQRPVTVFLADTLNALLRFSGFSRVKKDYVDWRIKYVAENPGASAIDSDAAR